jgi:hypothetical protein
MSSLVFGYGITRTILFWKADRPEISSFVTQNARTKEDIVDLDEFDFKVAFAIESFDNDQPLELLNDPDYVEWVPYFTEVNTDGTIVTTPVGFHICTSQDFE